MISDIYRKHLFRLFLALMSRHFPLCDQSQSSLCFSTSFVVSASMSSTPSERFLVFSLPVWRRLVCLRGFDLLGSVGELLGSFPELDDNSVLLYFSKEPLKGAPTSFVRRPDSAPGVIVFAELTRSLQSHPVVLSTLMWTRCRYWFDRPSIVPGGVFHLKRQ